LQKVAGQRTDQVGLVVMVSRKTRMSCSPGGAHPEQIEGVPVDVREVGEMNAL